jgi:hypothetical protein
VLVWILAATATVATVGGFTDDSYRVVPGPLSPEMMAQATPVELAREVRSQEGQRVVVPVTGGGSLATIEWRRANEVRARAVSGEPLGPSDLAALRASEVRCGRGDPRDVSERIERNGTWVLTFDCAWLQGLEAQ